MWLLVTFRFLTHRLLILEPHNPGKFPYGIDNGIEMQQKGVWKMKSGKDILNGKQM